MIVLPYASVSSSSINNHFIYVAIRFRFACGRSMKINGRTQSSCRRITGAKRMWRHCHNSRIEELMTSGACSCLQRKRCVTISFLPPRNLECMAWKVIACVSFLYISTFSIQISPFRNSVLFISFPAVVFNSLSFYETWRVYPVSIICSVGHFFLIEEREYQSRRFFVGRLSLLSRRSLQPSAK